MTIVEFFREVPEAVVAFSGGVDSAALLALAARHARRTKAYFVRTPFQPAFELQGRGGHRPPPGGGAASN